jgi:hypothetical protein
VDLAVAHEHPIGDLRLLDCPLLAELDVLHDAGIVVDPALERVVAIDKFR